MGFTDWFKTKAGGTPPTPSVVEEAGLPSNWTPIDVAPITPMPNAPPGGNIDMSSGPLPPNFGYQPALVKTGYTGKTAPIDLMPLPASPADNAKSQGVAKIIVQQAIAALPPSVAASPAVDFQTNGTDNAVQTKLNLIAGTGVSLVSDLSGGVTVNSANGIVFQASVSLTSAQLLALNTTYVTVIPAPGSGLYTVPIYASATYTFVTTAYTITGAANIWWVPQGQPAGPSGPGQIIVFTNGLVDQTQSLVYQSGGLGSTVDPVGQYTNSPYQVGIPAGNTLTLGDGTLKITIWYAVAAL